MHQRAPWTDKLSDYCNGLSICFFFWDVCFLVRTVLGSQRQGVLMIDDVIVPRLRCGPICARSGCCSLYISSSDSDLQTQLFPALSLDISSDHQRQVVRRSANANSMAGFHLNTQFLQLGTEHCNQLCCSGLFLFSCARVFLVRIMLRPAARGCAGVSIVLCCVPSPLRSVRACRGMCLLTPV